MPGSDDVLARLVDTGHLAPVRQSDAAPLEYAESSTYAFDVIDLLASEICRAVKNRDEIGYDDEAVLKAWCVEADVEIPDDRTFHLALDGLFRAGRLASPRPNEWTRKEARPTWYVPVKPYTG